jgi:hypothetical protein
MTLVMRTKRFGVVIASLSLVGLAAVAGETQVPSRTELAGVYRLSGSFETVAQLQLQADGRFAYATAYGGVDQHAAGTWSTSGKSVSLRTDQAALPRFVWGKSETKVHEDYRGDPQRPVALVVKVTSPELGLSWSNIEVTAEFSNGKVRSGLTSDRGSLGFLTRSEPEWQRAVVRRISVAYPKAHLAPQWFDVESTSTKTAVVYFIPGSFIPSAFERLDLRVERTGTDSVVELVDAARGRQPRLRLRRMQ